MSNYIIRFAKPTDLPTIITLCGLHAAFEKVAYDPKGKQERLKMALFGIRPRLNCLILEVDKAIVGYATYMNQYSTWDANSYVYLDCIFIEEAYRGRGYGKALMLVVKEEAAHSGAAEIQWQTPDFNHSAIAFYKKLGSISKCKERFFWEIT